MFGCFLFNRFFLKDITNPKHLEHKQNMLSKMEQYLVTTTCRRICILSHFESKSVDGVGGTERCCDNCLKRYLPPSGTGTADSRCVGSVKPRSGTCC